MGKAGVRIRRQDVIDGAMALLDEEGLDALTTRRLADRLGVRVGALYWHVRDKREVLVSLTERIMAESMPAAGDGGWEEVVAEAAHRLRAAMLRHRDGARLVAAHAAECDHGQGVSDGAKRMLRAMGIPPAAGAYVRDAVMSYVTGFVLQEQAAGPGSVMATPPETRDEAFAAGLGLIVSGIRATYFSPSGPGARPGTGGGR